MRFLRLVTFFIGFHLVFNSSSLYTVFASTTSQKSLNVTLSCINSYQINGWVVLIYLLLLLLFIYALVVIIERSLAYISAKRSSQIYSQRVALALSANLTPEAINISKAYSANPLAKALTNVLQTRHSATQKNFDAEAFQVAARNYAMAVCEEALNKNLAGLKKAGKIALILGGAGSGIGISDAIREFQYFDYPDEFYSVFNWYLSESFTVFLFSLFIAAPCLWFYKRFSETTQNLTGELEIEFRQLINRLVALPQNKIKPTKKIETPTIKIDPTHQTVECKLFSDFIPQ